MLRVVRHICEDSVMPAREMVGAAGAALSAREAFPAARRRRRKEFRDARVCRERAVKCGVISMREVLSRTVRAPCAAQVYALVRAALCHVREFLRNIGATECRVRQASEEGIVNSAAGYRVDVQVERRRAPRSTNACAVKRNRRTAYVQR